MVPPFVAISIEQSIGVLESSGLTSWSFLRRSTRMNSFPTFLPSRKSCSNSARDIEDGEAFLGAGYAACQGVSVCVLEAEVVFSVAAITARTEYIFARVN
jgi:hypothetical protein